MLEEHQPDVPRVGNLIDGESRQVAPPAAVVANSRDVLLHPPAVDPAQQRNASSIQLPSISQQHPPAQDGIMSLQSQLQVHSQILEEQRHEIENQRRHLARIDGAMEALHHEQRNIYAMIDEVRHEVRARGPVPEHHPDTSEVDILTEQVQTIGAKANEIAGLKMQLDILRRQVRRLERHGSPTAGGEPSGHEQSAAGHVPTPTASFVTNTSSAPEQRSLLYQTPAENRLPAPIGANSELPEPRVSESRTLPGIRSIDPTPLSSWRPAGTIAPPPPVSIAGSSPQIEPPAPGSGWAAVNSNPAPKRLISENVSFESPVPGSPKRQRLAPLMPRTYDHQNSTHRPPYHSVSADSLPTVPTLQSTRNSSNESTGSVPPQANALRFVQFSQGLETAPEEAWRQEVSRSGGLTLERGRGSPRRGRGGKSRGGRKSGGGEGDRATPEWESRSDQTQGPPALISEHSGESTAGMYPDPHFMPITTSADVASSNHPTKKTRTKPVRNADGVLIRKDGRPDMRSVSSAMNLKKVHAKKEAERAGNKEVSATSEDNKDKFSAHTPHSTSDHDAGEMSAASPSASSAHAMDNDTSAQERLHMETMRKVFPYGIEGGRSTSPSVQSMAQKYFPKSDDNRAAPDVKIEAVVESKEDPRQGHQDAKPLIDGERSMVHHTEGHVDVEMGEAK